jgi:hypothetical protein
MFRRSVGHEAGTSRSLDRYVACRVRRDRTIGQSAHPLSRPCIIALRGDIGVTGLHGPRWLRMAGVERRSVVPAHGSPGRSSRGLAVLRASGRCRSLPRRTQRRTACVGAAPRSRARPPSPSRCGDTIVSGGDALARRAARGRRRRGGAPPHLGTQARARRRGVLTGQNSKPSARSSSR